LKSAIEIFSVLTGSLQINDNNKGDFNYQCNFSPLDKYIEAMEENKKLFKHLLKEKDEKIALLEKKLRKKKK